MRKIRIRRVCAMILPAVLLFARPGAYAADGDSTPQGKTYVDYVIECADALIEHGTDRYGPKKTPILVSILDVESRTCPERPEMLDAPWRVVRNERRNPAGANLLPDQAMLRTFLLLSEATGDARFASFARGYVAYSLKHLVDDKGFLWWGWHRHYDVHQDRMVGHLGNHHEIHAIHKIDWDLLGSVDPDAVRREIEAIWRWHVIDKKTGEINRHGDGKKGCDFAMSAGAYIEAFAYLYAQTKDQAWLDRARLLADYYWARRHPATGLLPDRPNAGTKRFDGGSCVTSLPGLYCQSLLVASERTGDASFRNQAVAYLKAWTRYASDRKTGTFWGALRLDGTPIPGPRVGGGYAQYEPRGLLDLWEPYVAGYQYAVYTAQAYAGAFHATQESAFLNTATCFADWIDRTPPGTVETEKTWYSAFSGGFGRKGAHAGKYGRAVSFFIHLHLLTKEDRYVQSARRVADEAIAKLCHKGLFRGHPSKPYYEAIDGVGYLMYALLQLNELLRDPQAALSRREIRVGKTGTPMPLDNR
jgi:hypothetical protein